MKSVSVTATVAPDHTLSAIGIPAHRLHIPPNDCRGLLRFVDEASDMLGPLGYTDLDDFITRGLQLDPVMVGRALEGLRRLRPDEAVPFERAITLGQRGAQPGNQNARKGKTAAQNKPVISRFVYGSTNVAYLTARLARDRPDLLQRLQEGEFANVR